MPKANEITPEQLGQLLHYAGKRGRTWKSQLVKAWTYGYCPTPELSSSSATPMAWLGCAGSV